MPHKRTGTETSGNVSSRRTRILVINDTQEILEAFKDILEDEGYEALLYSYAITDLHEIEQLAPDLIILDYVFGQEKLGWQTLQLLKMHRTTATIPVIVCTAATNAVREIEGYMVAHDIQLVPKPFDIDHLIGAVKQGLDNAPSSVKLLMQQDKRRENNAADSDQGDETGATDESEQSGQ